MKDLFLKDVRRIVQATNNGAYGYHCKVNWKGRPDNCNTFHALLGVRSGARARITIPGAYWKLTADHWLKGQDMDGGWMYMNNPDKFRTSLTTTAAGVTCLATCRKYLFATGGGGQAKKKVNESIQQGLDLLTKTPTISGEDAYNEAWHFPRVGSVRSREIRLTQCNGIGIFSVGIGCRGRLLA